MRVLIVSEGPHERAGALENLLVKLGGNHDSFESERVANDNIHTHPGKYPGYTKKAIRWLLEAEKRNYNALIFLIDEDGKRERRKQIKNAQNTDQSQLLHAMGVAIKTFDAWMLADEKALNLVLGCKINRQKEPEKISDPKKVCQELLEKSETGIPQREMYARVSSNMDIDILSDRCQKGFKPFAAYVRKIFE